MGKSSLLAISILALLSTATAPAQAVPFTSWHAVFVSDDDGKTDADEMKQAFANWSWTDAGGTHTWDTASFASRDTLGAFAWLRQRAGPNEISVFLYSGHATFEYFEENNKEESPVEDPPKPPANNDLLDEAIPTAGDDMVTDDQIGDELRRIPGFTVSIFDMCWSGGMVDGKADINGKNADGSDKANELVMMSASESEKCVTLPDHRGVFIHYLLKTFPDAVPTVGAFSDWFDLASVEYIDAFQDNPADFNKEFQTFKLATYQGGERDLRYSMPEPSTLALILPLVVGAHLLRTRRLGGMRFGAAEPLGGGAYASSSMS